MRSSTAVATLAATLVVSLVATTALFAAHHRARASLRISVPFVATLHGNAVRCGAPLDDDGAPFNLRDLRVFVSDFRVIDPRGREVAATLAPDGHWQSEDVALLDFEDASGQCEGTAAMHTTLEVDAPSVDIGAIAFRVGVPFAKNHRDPTRAEAPLTVGGLHWGWQAGFKFMRAEAMRGGVAQRVHLGETGCAGTIGHVTACRESNRAEIKLDHFVVGKSRVAIDLGALFGDRPTATTSCMSDASDEACGAPMTALGLFGGEQHAFAIDR